MIPEQNKGDRAAYHHGGTISDIETGDVGRGDSYLSKLVILRGERHDDIVITNVIREWHKDADIPERATIVQRSNPYYGPKIVLWADERNYLLTTPGPETQLLLWASNITEGNQRTGWEKLAEVTARLADNLPPYEFCPQCSEPLKTLKHEKQAELGCCPRR